MNDTDLNPDVLIIGGGPAGTTAGTLLADKGYRVCLLEKGQHPKFHIGESLLPMNMPIFEQLGVTDQVAAMGVPKLGADFTYGEKSNEYFTYRFNRALGDSPPSAFEVKREDFDLMLFNRCQQAGVETRENTRVESLNLNDGKPVVISRDRDGHAATWNPKLVIDASGREAFAASRLGWKKKNNKHASVAIFGHYTGVTRRPGEDAGNISVYWHKHGWMWMIPLQNDVMSVGIVCWPDYIKTRNTDNEQFLYNTIADCPAAIQRMEGAKLVEPVRVAANYSYSSNRCWDDGFIAIGDAYAFVDPVFSSGVYLAMSSATRSIPAVEKWLQGDEAGFRKQCRKFARITNRGIKRFSWFIYRFTSPAMRNLFYNPRNTLGVEDAVISMLSGDVFHNAKVGWRLFFFRFLYGVSWLMTLDESLASRKRRLKAAKMPADSKLEVP